VAVLLLPLRWAGATPIATVNVALLVGHTLDAMAAYAFGRVVLGTRVGAAVVAAVIVGASLFGPPRGVGTRPRTRRPSVV